MPESPMLQMASTFFIFSSPFLISERCTRVPVALSDSRFVSKDLPESDAT